MRTIVTTLAILLSTIVFGQNSFETEMEKSLKLWQENKNTEATASLERIATVEKTNWLPEYYIALINITEALNSQDVQKNTLLIEKAQQALTKSSAKTNNNAEIMVVQAQIYLATLMLDPMNNGMKYSAMTQAEYEKAYAISPTNPRVAFGRAEFALGTARYMGTDTKPICEEITKTLELFNNFKPETKLHPNWGKERAEKTATSCK
jgi:hypothetical protein